MVILCDIKIKNIYKNAVMIIQVNKINIIHLSFHFNT